MLRWMDIRHSIYNYHRRRLCSIDGTEKVGDMPQTEESFCCTSLLYPNSALLKSFSMFKNGFKAFC